MGYRLGVDVGGTFTDLLLFNDETGAFWRHKTPSTPHDSSEGVMIGLKAICADAQVAPSQVEVFLHGTTVATNAVLEGKGARVGLVTTDGFRQMMQIARSLVPGGWPPGSSGRNPPRWRCWKTPSRSSGGSTPRARKSAR